MYLFGAKYCIILRKRFYVSIFRGDKYSMKPIIHEICASASVAYKFITSKKYREFLYVMLQGGGKRYREQIISLRGINFFVPDVASFYSTYEELIYKEIYKFSTDESNPVIVDCGANIGLSVYYFASNYPKASIYAYEADPNIFIYLVNNVKQFDTGRIYLFNQALYDKNTELCFFSEGADGGRVLTGSSNLSNDRKVFVEAVDVLGVLEKFEHIDFLKIDIEGAERVVVPRLSTQLKKIENIFVEYHSEKDKPQCLSNIVRILHENGFRVYMQPVFCPKRPLFTAEVTGDFDLQLNIFGKKL